MSVWTYLRSRVVWLACSVLVLAFLACFLPLLGVERDPAILVSIVVAVLLVVPGVHGYLRQRRLMRKLADIAESADDALELASLLREPGYPEGDLTVNALAAVVREGRREADAERADARAYQQYVEAWVHEIKTPLAAIRLFLANHADSALRPLRRELDRTEGYVEQALYYARSFSVERDYVIAPHNLADLVREAVRSRSGELIEAHVGVDLKGLADAPPVPCDEKWMRFVLGQLVDNAVHYRCDLERDGRPAHISFSARVEEAGTAHGRVVLDVRDNGCGISDADLPRVFDRGFTGDNGRTHRRSTGMGLYLVRTLCAKMGLAVVIASGPGQWTCVSLVFPLA